MTPGVPLLESAVDEHGKPTGNMQRECYCERCAQSGHAKFKSDTTRRCELEAFFRKMGLRRPFRRIKS